MHFVVVGREGRGKRSIRETLPRSRMRQISIVRAAPHLLAGILSP
jgi:hypothetical protein